MLYPAQYLCGQGPLNVHSNMVDSHPIEVTQHEEPLLDTNRHITLQVLLFTKSFLHLNSCGKFLHEMLTFTCNSILFLLSFVLLLCTHLRRIKHWIIRLAFIFITALLHSSVTDICQLSISHLSHCSIYGHLCYMMSVTINRPFPLAST